MANWNNPVNTTSYLTVLSDLKGRDEDLATMFDVGSPTSIPTNAVRWNSANNRFEKYNGATYDVLSSSYAINVTQLGGIGSTGYLRLTTGGSQTFSAGGLTIDGNVSAALILKGGTANAVYISLYANAAAQGTRTGYMGFGGVADTTLYIINEYSNGDIYLNAAGTGKTRIADILRLESTDVERNITTSSLSITGGTTGGNGSIVKLYGSTHSSQAHDIELFAGGSAAGNRIFWWDESAGTLQLRGGTAATKAQALLINANRDIDIDKNLTIGSDLATSYALNIKGSATGSPVINLVQSATTRGFLRYLNSSSKVQLSAGTSIGLDLIVNNSTTALSIASTGVATFSSTVIATEMQGDYIKILQQASQAGAATFGTLWVKNTSPTELHYVDSGSNDFRISPNLPVSGHIRAGNIQLYDGESSPGSIFSASVNVTEGVVESVGPTGSGANNIWTTMDQLPANATILIVGVYLSLQDSVGGASLRLYVSHGDDPTPSVTIFNQIGQVSSGQSGEPGRGTILTQAYIPLGATNQTFYLVWTGDANVTESIDIYYRGFITD